MKLTFSEPAGYHGRHNAAINTITPNLAATEPSDNNKTVTFSTANRRLARPTPMVPRKASKIFPATRLPPACNKPSIHCPREDGVLKFSYRATPRRRTYCRSSGGRSVGSSAPTCHPDCLAVYSFNSRDAFPGDSHENYLAPQFKGYLILKETGVYGSSITAMTRRSCSSGPITKRSFGSIGGRNQL